MTAAPKKSPTKKTRGKSLTLKQKAEAVALWRSGEVTLEDLGTKFSRRPESFSRLFKRMGIEKGSAVKAAAAKMEEATAAAAVDDHQQTLTRIRDAKEDHFKMANGLAKLAWAEIVRARQAKLGLETLKEVMQTLKLAGEVIGNSRKELYVVLGVEEAERKKEDEDLPELTVRELTTQEVDHLQKQSLDDDGMDNAPVEDIGDLDIREP
jgi:sugar-specific transcriptional regulator TrmB